MLTWITMWIALSASALAQPATAEAAFERVERAQRAYEAGQLTEAATLAQEAVLADPSNVTASARRVLVEVALRAGDLDAADALISDLYAVPYLRPALQEWAKRATKRAQIERLESSGDAASALTLLGELPTDSLDDWEKAWLARLIWRLPLRALEQQLRLRDARSALQDEARRDGLNEDDLRWIAGAQRRVEVLLQVHRCEAATARALASDMVQDASLRPADRVWARLEVARGDLRALQNDPDALSVPLSTFLAFSQGSPAHQAWAKGLRAWVELAQLQAQGDPEALTARASTLKPIAEAWRAGEPGCAAPAAASVSRANVTTPGAPWPGWAQLALVGGQEAWSLRLLDDAPAKDPLCERPCVSPTVALSARGGVTVWGPLGAAVGATLTLPLQTLVVGDSPPVLSSAWLGVGYTGSSMSWLVGPRMYTSLLVQGDADAPSASTSFIPLAQLTGRLTAADLGLDAQMNLGSNVTMRLVELDVGWRQGEAPGALRVGVTGGLASGRWGLFDNNNTLYTTQQQDWRMGLSAGVDWERR